jgi:hypothetical protein
MVKRILLCMSLLGVSVFAASPSGNETRTHYVVANRDRTPAYYATVISTNSESLGSEIYLFENPAGQRVRINVRKNYKSRLVTAEYSVNVGKPVKVTLQLPGSASTRSETLKQYKEHPELQNEDVLVTVDSGDEVLKTREREWKSGKADVRKKAKSIAGSEIASAMQSLSSVLGSPEFGGACSTFEFVSDGQKCRMSTSLMIAKVRPDCGFDARFGMQCNEAQKQRAKNQPKSEGVGSY